MQAAQSELIRRQEEILERNSHRTSPRYPDTRTKRTRASRSRSPGGYPRSNRRRSRSPESNRSRSFRPSTQGPNRRDRLSACPICLGRHRHHTASCQATKTWNGEKARCSRASNGRILNRRGAVICADWQRPNRCTDDSGKHLHECSGCGSAGHGADACPSAQA